MAVEGKTLARAKAALAEKRIKHEELLLARTDKVYAQAPRVRELDAEIRATMAELVGIALGEDAAAKVEDIRLRNLDLQKQRKSEIAGAGFPEDYLDNEYICSKCCDKGYVKSEMCDCLAQLCKEEQKAALSSLLKLGNETFESFNLSYYDDTAAPDKGISPRESMDVVYKLCIKYAQEFGSESMNLLFIGAPGLGKTFLSACIARVVADNGFSVVYDMASSIFARFEDVQFQRTDDLVSSRDEIKRYLECDLLIIDDLGTEMTTNFTISVLYEIINTRLVTGKKTLVSSNLTLEEMHRRYSEQTMSRLEWDYQVLKFYGEDIRKRRSEVQ